MKPYLKIFLLLPFIFFGCTKETIQNKQITITVITENPDKNSLFISGNNNMLGDWDANAVPLEKKSDSVWTRTFSFPAGSEIEFKFTKGSWQSEALDENGNVPSNHILKVEKDTTLTFKILKWNQNKIGKRTFITASLFDEGSGLELFDDWKYKKGDNLKWKEPDFNDSLWESSQSKLIPWMYPKSGWNGIGWFRFNFFVDSSLWNRTVAMNVDQFGASEIYLNGKLIYKIGRIGDSSSEFIAEQNRIWRPLTFEAKQEQTLAIRFANYDSQYHNDQGFEAGFSIMLKNLEDALTSDNLSTRRNYQTIFTIIPFVLAFLHFLLFIFYPKKKQNLYYSVCLVGFAGIAFFTAQSQISTIPENIIFYYKVTPLATSVAVLFGLFTTYAGYYKKLPKQAYFFLVLAIVSTILGFFRPAYVFNETGYLFFALSLIEISRVLYKSIASGKKGTWFIISGYIFLIIAIIYQLLISINMIPTPNDINFIFGFGVMALIISMSVSLSYDFSRINKSLEKQLQTVEELSRINLKQERIVKEKEIERVKLESDNKRKTEELNEARKLQLSMLPKKIPDFPNYDIAVYMKTATEVGGDYYDFHKADDGSLFIVIGDATGHGAKAGIMVTAIKSIFKALAAESEPVIMIDKFASTIRALNFEKLFMSLCIVKFKENKMIVSNAGMPPAFYFKCEKGKTERIIQKSLPLGSYFDFPYKQEEYQLNKGDAILLMSDGFTEMFNKDGEIFESEKGIEMFEEIIKEKSQKIIDHLVLKTNQWAGTETHKDDITLIAVKYI